MPDRGCSHLNAISSVKQPEIRECAECVKIGASWVHLRTCQQCGVTLCCDSSPNRHASKHAHASAHPVIAGCTVIPTTRFANTESSRWMVGIEQLRHAALSQIQLAIVRKGTLTPRERRTATAAG